MKAYEKSSYWVNYNEKHVSISLLIANPTHHHSPNILRDNISQFQARCTVLFPESFYPVERVRYSHLLVFFPTEVMFCRLWFISFINSFLLFRLGSGTLWVWTTYFAEIYSDKHLSSTLHVIIISNMEELKTVSSCGQKYHWTYQEDNFWIP